MLPSTQRTYVQSSSVRWVQWHPAGRVTVAFVNGGKYDYSPCDAMLMQRFLQSSSKGRFVNWVLKQQCSATPVP